VSREAHAAFGGFDITASALLKSDSSKDVPMNTPAGVENEIKEKEI
tara:strand:- start:296 stop:433 length:138 start_codon:yes stop_codon:yes gene_type:complete